jgi:hypothetical protein
VKHHVLGLAATSERAVSLADLTDEQMLELIQVLGFRPDTFLCACVQHPESHLAALLACLVNFPENNALDQLVQITQHTCS